MNEILISHLFSTKLSSLKEVLISEPNIRAEKKLNRNQYKNLKKKIVKIYNTVNSDIILVIYSVFRSYSSDTKLFTTLAHVDCLFTSYCSVCAYKICGFARGNLRNFAGTLFFDFLDVARKTRQIV